MSQRPRLLTTLSKRLINRGSSPSAEPKHSLLGELLRSSAPPWIEVLVETKLSKAQAVKLVEGAVECPLCKASIVNRGALEPGMKKLCSCCSKVTCRFCCCSVHLVGRLRRRYVCFECVGEAAKLLKDPASSMSASMATRMETAAGGDDKEMNGFMQQLWERGTTAQRNAGDHDDSDVDDEGFEDTVASFGEDRSRTESIAALPDSQGFDGDALKSLLDASVGAADQAVNAVLFTRACSEVIKLLAGLGKAFEFASTDMQGKCVIMAMRIDERARELGANKSAVSIQALVEKEIAAGTATAGKSAKGAARTVLRLLWFYDFVGVLLRKLGSDAKAELKASVAATYEETLAARHVWILRRVVRTGMSLVPDRQVLIASVGLKDAPDALQRLVAWADSMDRVRNLLWAFMKAKGVEELP